MSHVLFLTDHEKKLFASLRDDLQSEWSQYITDEDLTDWFENDEQLDYRFSLANFGQFPEVQRVLDQVASADGDLSQVSIDTLPKDALQMLYSCVGATGVTFFMELAMQEVNNADDLDNIATLSRVRHGLLRSNQDFFSQS